MSKTIYEALNRASSFLEENNREKEVARYILQFVLGKNYSELMMAMYEEISTDSFNTFWSYVEEHATGRPYQYIIGQETFYDREFLVIIHSQIQQASDLLKAVAPFLLPGIGGAGHQSH